MVLPPAQLKPFADGLDVDLGSGPVDNAAAADDTIDPKDTATQIGAAGRITGYSLSYSELSGAPLLRGHGLLGVGTSVQTFRSAAAADAFLAKELRDARFRGKYVEGGLHLTGLGTFPAAGIGAHAMGVRETVTFGDKRVQSTSVAFRAGNVVGSAVISRADAASTSAAVTDLARILAARIDLAGSGTLTENPVPVPQVGRKGHAPEGGPDLASMALAKVDLPAGAKVVRQEYVADTDSIGSFEREFDVSAATFGQSTLVTVTSNVSLLRTPAEAAGISIVIGTVFGSKDLAKLYESEGLQGVQIELQKPLAAGDQAVAAVLVARARGQVVRLVQIFVRSGRALGYLTIAGSASTLSYSDVEPLATAFAKRLAAG